MGILTNLSSAGFTYSDYPTTLSYVKGIYTSIYGSNIYLEADSQDGQLCMAFAAALYDTNQSMALLFQTLSPTYAQGTQLSSEVLINGISRKPATNSTVTLTLTGLNGTVINGASAKDTLGAIWNITSGIIGISGTIDLFATSATSGAITALPNTITTINTPTAGWNTVTNTYAATIGQAIETDMALRQRQKISVATPSQTNVTGVLGGILTLTNVLRAVVYENFMDTIDSNGLPPHSLCAVVDGGDPQLIADQISLRKTIGANTYGTTTKTSFDSVGTGMIINFFVCAYSDLKMAITIQALAGYSTNVITAIQTSLVNYLNALIIGDDVIYSRLFTYANLNGIPMSETFDVQSLQIGLSSGSLGNTNVIVPFNSVARIDPSNIVITVV